MVVSDWISKYKVGVVESIVESGGKGTKALKICQVDIGLDNLITVVTSAPNVRLHSRLAVAPIGSTVLSPSGENEGLLITKTSIGGVMSEGMFCDSTMLAWDGGSYGIAAQIDVAIPIGDPPPGKKPRPKHEVNTTELAESNVEGLFKKKLTKDEKKKLNDEKKKLRKAAKEAAAAITTTTKSEKVAEEE
jgi:tRNA-binding EMAP/Myf-like protein